MNRMKPSVPDETFGLNGHSHLHVRFALPALHTRRLLIVAEGSNTTHISHIDIVTFE